MALERARLRVDRYSLVQPRRACSYGPIRRLARHDVRDLVTRDVERRDVGRDHGGVGVHDLAEDLHASTLPAWRDRRLHLLRRGVEEDLHREGHLRLLERPHLRERVGDRIEYGLRLLLRPAVVVQRDVVLLQRREVEARVLMDVLLLRCRCRVAGVVGDLPVIGDLRAGDDEDAAPARELVVAADRAGSGAVRDGRGAGAVRREVVDEARLLCGLRGGVRRA